MKPNQEQVRFNKYHEMIAPQGRLIYVGQLLKRAAHQWPDNIALICQADRISYKDLYYRSLLMSKQLKNLGIKPRDRVIIAYENNINFYIAYFAVWQIGAVVAPVNTLLHEKEFEHIIGDAQPSLLILSNKQRAKVEKLSIPLPPILSEEAFDRASPLPATLPDLPIEELDPEEMAALLYTSGTTGLPKGVMLSSRNILTNLVQGASRLDVSHNDRAYCALPLFHSLTQNTCVWGAVFIGACVILVPKIDRSSLVEGLSHNPTIMIGVPALYGFFCRFRQAPFTTISYFFCGGDALPDKIRLYFDLIYQRKLCNGYGLTETAPLISVDLEDHLVPTNTVGKPVIGMQCQLRNDDNTILTNGIGTLWVKGDNVMLGYYNASEATALVLQDGWLNTGDIAYFDEQNNIVICGREKDIIVNKGIKIYPQEIENILMTHERILLAAVVGKPDKDGEIPIAFIMVKDIIPENFSHELRAFCAAHLATYKIPHDFIVATELPLTSTGKVDKKLLRKQLEKPQ
jgi:long-chain acyl-CoA synthetase